MQAWGGKEASSLAADTVLLPLRHKRTGLALTTCEPLVRGVLLSDFAQLLVHPLLLLLLGGAVPDVLDIGLQPALLSNKPHAHYTRAQTLVFPAATVSSPLALRPLMLPAFAMLQFSSTGTAPGPL